MKIAHLVATWHRAVNERDAITIIDIVADDIQISEPDGRAVELEQIFKWIDQSGIRIKDVAHYLVAPDVMIVEEVATWPVSPAEVRVFSRYRSDGKCLISIDRYYDLEAALKPDLRQPEKEQP